MANELRRFRTKVGDVQVGKVYVDRDDLKTEVRVTKLAPFGGSVEVAWRRVDDENFQGGQSAGIFRTRYCTKAQAVKERADREKLRKEMLGS